MFNSHISEKSFINKDLDQFRDLALEVIKSSVEDLSKVVKDKKFKRSRWKTEVIDLYLDEDAVILRFWGNFCGIEGKSFREGVLSTLGLTPSNLESLKNRYAKNRLKK